MLFHLLLLSGTRDSIFNYNQQRLEYCGLSRCVLDRIGNRLALIAVSLIWAFWFNVNKNISNFFYTSNNLPCSWIQPAFSSYLILPSSEWFKTIFKISASLLSTFNYFWKSYVFVAPLLIQWYWLLSLRDCNKFRSQAANVFPECMHE